jgi:DnaK suppressor protein
MPAELPHVMNPGQSRINADPTKIRARLWAMAETLELRHAALPEALDAVREEVVDDVDRAQHLSDARFVAALELSIIDARAQIARALIVLDAGGYGVCEDCGADISEARLDFRPESTRCLHCQTAADQRGR